jgi:hypothetical protein
MTDAAPARRLTGIVLRSLARGHAVEIDGFGTFYPDRLHGVRFEAATLPQVFIAYVREDRELADRLYQTVEAAGFSPWMDTRKLLPGQNWPRAIETAIENSEFFLACFSSSSVNQRGGFQAEIRYALDCARSIPLEEIYIVPVRLDECPVPRAIQCQLQYIDFFPDWDRGARYLGVMMRREIERKKSLAAASRDRQSLI